MKNDVISRYITYKTERAKAKARQRIELERDLAPFLKAFGEEILVAQNEDGMTIEQIEGSIASKNRNLIYAAQRLAKGKTSRAHSVTSVTPPESVTEPEKPAEKQRWEVLVLAPDGSGADYEVYLDNRFVGHAGYNGNSVLVLPEAWALDRENKSQYAEIVKWIKEHHASN